MTPCESRSFKSQAGYTLTDVAIIILICGFLVGGGLKWRTMISDSQVRSAIAQVQNITSAMDSFRDEYGALPGDLLGASARIPNCKTAPCASAAANGNGMLDNTPAEKPIGTEGESFFVQLFAAGLWGGVKPAEAGSMRPGDNFPIARIGSNTIIAAGSLTGNREDFPDLISATAMPMAGTWLVIAHQIGPASADNIGLTPDQAAQMDAKMDDGVPDTGKILAFGPAGAKGCATPGAYGTSTWTVRCGLYIHIQ